MSIHFQIAINLLKLSKYDKSMVLVEHIVYEYICIPIWDKIYLFSRVYGQACGKNNIMLYTCNIMPFFTIIGE